jgi:hypothetical protein
MKHLLTLITLIGFSAASQAAVVQSSDVQVSIARVQRLTNLVNKPMLQVNVAVQDLGGSTDVSPTQKVFLTLYSKGEMFSTDATFEIADVLEVISAARVTGGVYEVTVREYNETFETVTYRIDAREAVNAIQAVDCGDNFDCDASTNFRSKVIVTKAN